MEYYTLYIYITKLVEDEEIASYVFMPTFL